MSYKLGSLFDGSGGFPLAGSLCGIEPRWASEVEPYPIAVTRSRFPNMKHLGDISKVSGAEIEPVDIITFGSPCQDLSVAGKRAGLKHEDNGDDETTRSGLFMEAVRIIREMREATNGEYPSFALWENVPGAFSSNKGEDFRTVLAELINIVEPDAVMPPVPKGGWNYADSYVGDGWSLAYRVFDAQYWGVPQRRRRIHLVLDLRGERAREVLFEREGVRGYFAQSGAQGQGTAADAEGSAGADDRAGEDGCLNPWDYQSKRVFKPDGIFPTLQSGERSEQNQQSVLIPYTLKIRSGCEGGGKGALVQENKSATLATNNDQYLFQPMACYPELAHSLTARHDGSPQPDKGNGSNIVVQAAGFKAGNGPKAHGIGYEEEVAPALSAAPSGTNQAPSVVVKTYDARGNGDGETVNTLTSADRHAIFAMQSFGDYKLSDVASGLKARDYKDATDLVCGVDCRNMNESPELYPTLQAKPNGGQSLNFSHAVRIYYIVRRLTPTECARLQGFADRWGDIEPKDDFTVEEFHFWLDVRNTLSAIKGKPERSYTKAQMLTWYNRLHTDSSEYKMWGNGIAFPPALYCMQGMADALAAYEDDEEWAADLRLLKQAAAEEMEIETEGDVTDLSGAPEVIKEAIMENAEKLEMNPAGTSQSAEPEHGLNAVDQLKKLADERRALANISLNSERFKSDIRAIEYAVSVLEALAI